MRDFRPSDTRAPNAAASAGTQDTLDRNLLPLGEQHDEDERRERPGPEEPRVGSAPRGHDHQAEQTHSSHAERHLPVENRRQIGGDPPGGPPDQPPALTLGHTAWRTSRGRANDGRRATHIDAADGGRRANEGTRQHGDDDEGGEQIRLQQAAPSEARARVERERREGDHGVRLGERAQDGSEGEPDEQAPASGHAEPVKALDAAMTPAATAGGSDMTPCASSASPGLAAMANPAAAPAHSSCTGR